MSFLRQHPNLETLLKKEAPGIPNPRQSATRILQETPAAQTLVFFRDRAAHWTVVPIGPGHKLHSLGEASRARVDGKTPVAYCPV